MPRHDYAAGDSSIRLRFTRELLVACAAGLVLASMISRPEGDQKFRDSQIANASEPISGEEQKQCAFVIYTADWCEPCQRLKRALDKNPHLLRGVPVEWRDVDPHWPPNVVVPDIRYLEDGVVKARKIGYTDLESLAEWLDANVF